MPPHLPNDDEPAKRGVQKRVSAAYSRPIIDFRIPGGAEIPPGPVPEPVRRWPRVTLAVAACGMLLAGSGYAVMASLQQYPGSETGGPNLTMPLIEAPAKQPDETLGEAPGEASASTETDQSAQSTIPPAEGDDPSYDTHMAPPSAEPPPDDRQEEAAAPPPEDSAPPAAEETPDQPSGPPGQRGNNGNGQGPPGGGNGQGPPPGVPAGR